MQQLVSSFTGTLSTFTLLGQGLVVVLLFTLVVTLLAPKKKNNFSKFRKLVADNYIAIVFLFAVVATAGSLFYSELAEYVPCKLCWWQRIFMYPMSVISFIALIKNDLSVKRYLLPLSLIGFVIALYHSLMQMFPQALKCSEELAKCNVKNFAAYGYITIPVMAATLFAIIIVTLLLSWDLKKK